jgi:hypothetical protein
VGIRVSGQDFGQRKWAEDQLEGKSNGRTLLAFRGHCLDFRLRRFHLVEIFMSLAMTGNPAATVKRTYFDSDFFANCKRLKRDAAKRQRFLVSVGREVCILHGTV